MFFLSLVRSNRQFSLHALEKSMELSRFYGNPKPKEQDNGNVAILPIKESLKSSSFLMNISCEHRWLCSSTPDLEGLVGLLPLLLHARGPRRHQVLNLRAQPLGPGARLCSVVWCILVCTNPARPVCSSGCGWPRCRGCSSSRPPARSRGEG